MRLKCQRRRLAVLITAVIWHFFSVERAVEYEPTARALHECDHAPRNPPCGVLTREPIVKHRRLVFEKKFNRAWFRPATWTYVSDHGECFRKDLADRSRSLFVGPIPTPLIDLRRRPHNRIRRRHRRPA